MQENTTEYLALQQLIQVTLRRHAFDNRGSLPLSMINDLGSVLARVLLISDATLQSDAMMFANRGLALSSIASSGLALKNALVTAGNTTTAANVGERLARLMVAVDEAAMVAFQAEQERIRMALTRARRRE